MHWVQACFAWQVLEDTQFSDVFQVLLPWTWHPLLGNISPASTIQCWADEWLNRYVYDSFRIPNCIIGGKCGHLVCDLRLKITRSMGYRVEFVCIPVPGIVDGVVIRSGNGSDISRRLLASGCFRGGSAYDSLAIHSGTGRTREWCTAAINPPTQVLLDSHRDFRICDFFGNDESTGGVVTNYCGPV